MRKVEKKYYIGVDIGGTKIAAALVDSQGHILANGKIATPRQGAGLQIFNCTKKLIQDLLKKRSIDAVDFEGIGVGVPGIIKPNRKDILITPNVNLSGFPLAKKLEEGFKTNVVLGNDVNLGMLGEKWLGIGKDVDHAIGLFPGTGLGGAIIIDGKLVSGTQGAAGELGHVIMDLHSDKQSAGVYGSLEALASRRAIERDIREGLKQGEESVVTELLKKKSDVIKSGVIAKALAKKDALVMRVIDEACDVLGKACISMRHIFNPQMIIFGGGVIEACGDYMLPRIRKVSEGDPFFKDIDHCQIESSVLRDDAVILGAVALLRQDLNKNRLEKVQRYPDISLDASSDIHVNNKLLKKNIYVRADGKVKKINASAAFLDLKEKSVLGLAAVKKVCKKKPCALIVASPRRKLKISAEGMRFLKKKGIAAHELGFSEAVKCYKVLKTRKAIVLYKG